jgi:hypothetical protein
MSEFIISPTSVRSKSLSNGGPDEKAYPGRLGTMMLNAGDVDAERIVMRSRNSMKEPGHPCSSRRGTASGSEERCARKWMSRVAPSEEVMGTVYWGCLFISAS